jgi:hypothetical protein
MNKTFLHAGDIGDIIYSLPTIRALGGGTLYLDCNGGQEHPVVQEYYKINGKPRLKFNHTAYKAVETLLTAQSYVKAVYQWDGMRQIDYNLTDFRHIASKEPSLNLAEAHLKAFGIPVDNHLDPWLRVTQSDTDFVFPSIAKTARKYAVSRSLRSQGNHAWWDVNIRKFVDQAIFYGTDLEHKAFENAFDVNIDYIYTPGFLTAAQYIDKSEVFIGNTSALMAIAIGLGKPFFQEEYRIAPNNRFPLRTNGHYF